MGKKEQTPAEFYQSHQAEADKLVTELKKKHTKANTAASTAINKEMQGVDENDENAVLSLLANAAVEYKKASGIYGGDFKHDEGYELADIEEKLRDNQMSLKEAVKKFREGEGSDVLKDLMDSYKGKHVRGSHKKWFKGKVKWDDHETQDKLAKGYVEVSGSKDHYTEVKPNLEQKLLTTAYRRGQA
ncbi:hypothetical protein ACFL0V_00735 [Nanoarchaeota archaeon]